MYCVFNYIIAYGIICITMFGPERSCLDSVLMVNTMFIFVPPSASQLVKLCVVSMTYVIYLQILFVPSSFVLVRTIRRHQRALHHRMHIGKEYLLNPQRTITYPPVVINDSRFPCHLSPGLCHVTSRVGQLRCYF